jgi:hydrogenase expression/formation protein HypC
MCLAIPGKVLSMTDGDTLMRTGRVDFGGVIREVNLCYVPEVKLGDYVVVHVGFALSIVDEVEANQVFEYLRQIGELEIEDETE